VAAPEREELTIRLSEQNLTFAARLADRAHITEQGEIRYGGAMADLMRDEPARRAYLRV
jgi:branched-chain amino acid transport system ATP-binding protein